MDNAVIVDVEATPTRISKEVEATETMIERTSNTFDLKPKCIARDVAYGTGKPPGWLAGRGIELHVPVWDKGKRDDTSLSRDDFTFDPDGDVYVCPKGKVLKTTGTVHDGKMLLYRSSKRDCDLCSLKPKPLRPGSQKDRKAVWRGKAELRHDQIKFTRLERREG